SLILLDPDDAVPVREAKITSIPLVTPKVSLYDILNAFQEGGSHMAIVVGPAASLQIETPTPVPTDTSPLLGGGQVSASLTQSPPQMSRRWSNFIKGEEHANVTDQEILNSYVPVGIITLEDVIEELIQEEIIDETDVFVDMRRKIKVMRAVKLAQHPIRTAESDQGKRRGMAFSAR
ncbi:hypothetical protein EC988_009012, partial [Linderina pennispora]